MIAAVTPAEVLAHCRDTLGLPGDQDAVLDDTLLASLARRTAGIHCPCSRATLRASLLECMFGLPTSYDSLPDAVDSAIEALIVSGDLLELADVVIDDSEVRQTWVFAAPPRFVVRPSRSVFLMGVVPDQDTFLPSMLTARILSRGSTRMLEPEPGEDLPRQLRELGLQQLAERAWLRSPRAEDPADMLNRHERLLTSQPPITGIPDVQILDAARPVTYYPGRWTDPTDQDGMFVARRPQEFGAPIWCLVELREGRPVRLLDLPLARSRWRGCDAAWHLQAAVDHRRGTPQRYHRRVHDEGVRFDFFSPLPQWSERRLMNMGKSVPRDACLLSYVVPANEADDEEAFLQQNLWLAHKDSPG